MIVAIDGPAGTGKGTISKLVAERLFFTYIVPFGIVNYFPVMYLFGKSNNAMINVRGKAVKCHIERKQSYFACISSLN
jgi:deoxyadenosine/deoxycytidine kinase